MEKDFSFLHYLKTVTSDDQAYEDLSSDQLWLFYISETDVLGPFRQNDIIKLIPQYRHEFAPLKACTVSQKEWKPFFNHKCFNGRDLSKETQPKTKFRKIELIADKYLCLVNGVKKGPYSQNQIIELIQQKELKADALISADQGMTWHRAYSYPQFNRRAKQIIPEHQITMPDEAFEKTKLIVLDKIKRGSDSQDSGALSAALLSGKNKHLASEKINNIFAEKLQKVRGFSLSGKAKSNGKKTNPFFAVGLVAALLALLLLDSSPEVKDKKSDPLEVLQGSKKSRKTSSKYEDQVAPQPVQSYEESDVATSRRKLKNDQVEEEVIENDNYADNDQEEFNQEPNEYDDNSRRKSRNLSSTKKKAVKKLSISHQEDEPNENYNEEADLEAGAAEEEAETEDFELEE